MLPRYPGHLNKTMNEIGAVECGLGLEHKAQLPYRFIAYPCR
jgi:hypothetical protein